jgi:tetratricopeptide (TPR) repeat protein
LAASGNCNAYSGIGDPYLPFREVLDMLSGDVEARWEAGVITTGHARRLWAALPLVVQALLDHGPHVLGALVRGQALLSRAGAAASDGPPWLERLQERVSRQTGTPVELNQSHLFQQVTHVLRALAEHHPLLLVLDDLQWTDTASASLLFHLGRRLAGNRILIVGTYRPEEVALDRQGESHPLAQVLAELKRTFGNIWLDLAEVEEPEGRAFVDAFLATEPNELGEGFRRSLFEHTGGHPLFTLELLRAMQERGDLVQDAAGCWVEGASLDWGALPARVEGVIEARIGRLEEELREALAVASVEGEDFTAQVVARVQAVSERKLLRTLSRELERRHRLVRGRGEEQVGRRRLSRYRFAHALFQQYLYNDLSPGECRLLHGEVASVLEELHEGNLEEVAAPLAHHFSAAGDEEQTLKYLIVAGDRALAAYAHTEAEGHYRRALELAPNEAERAHLLSGLGEALSGQSRFLEAMETWREGIEQYKALADSDGVARLYAHSARDAREANLPGEDLRLGLEGLAAVEGAPDSHGVALLLRMVAGAYCMAPSLEEARPLANRALAMAERLGDVEVQAHTLATLGAFLLEGDEALEALARAVALAETNDLLQAGARAHNNLGVACASILSDLKAEQSHYRRSAELWRQTGNTPGQVWALTNLGWSLMGFGDFQEVAFTLSHARSLLDEVPEANWAEASVISTEADYLGLCGKWLAAARIFRAQVASARERGDDWRLAQVRYGLGWAVLESLRLGLGDAAGEWQEAEEALAEAAELYGRQNDPRGVGARLLLGILHVLQRRLDDGRRMLAEAREKVPGQTPDWLEAEMQVLVAQIAAAEGRWTEALAALEASAATNARLGVRWCWARGLLDWAEVHVARGEPGDRARARELLRQSQAAFAEMGVPRYATVAAERLQALGAGKGQAAELG